MASSPRGHVLTEVRATVEPSRHEARAAGFEELLAESRPEGLLRSELLHVDGERRIQTLWRDREALTPMGSSTAEPAAPKLFRSVGAHPELTILEVRVSMEA
jgi:hypothetical protein